MQWTLQTTMRLSLTLAVALAFAAVAVEAAVHDRVVCYYGSWAVYRQGNGKCNVEDIDPNLCTHLIYTFVGLKDNGDINVLDPWNDLPDNWGKDAFGRFNKLRLKNPKLKTLLAIGGWNEGSERYSKVVNNDALRANFVNSATKFILHYNFSGFDLDWEYPNQRGGVPSDVPAYSKLIKEMRAEFDKHDFLLTAAVAAAELSASKSYEIVELAKYLDWINVMTYDIHGDWDRYLGHNAPLFPRDDESETDRKYLNLEACINYWIKSGAPPEKLVLGIPLYGRTFTIVDPSRIKPGDQNNGAGTAGPYTRQRGFIGYNEICEFWGTNTKRYWDEQQMVPYAVKGNDWITYDDEESIKIKVEWAMRMNLGGAMVWSVETDDFRGVCGRKNPLLKTIVETLHGELPPTEPTTTRDPSETTISTESTTWTPRTTTESTSAGTTVSTTTTERPGGPFECPDDGYFRDEYNCGIFYRCIRRGDHIDKYEYRCPDTLLFDLNLFICLPCKDVDCPNKEC